MLHASHALIAASVAKLIPDPIIGLPLSIVLHFLGDLFPHWDFRTRKTKRSKLNIIFISLSDAFIGYTLGFLIFRSFVPLPYLFAIMIIGQLPDWLEAPYHIFDFNFPPFSSVKKLQSKLHNKQNLPWGLINQIIVVLVFILIAFI